MELPARYILFCRQGGWTAFPYPNIAALLALEGELYLVSGPERPIDLPTSIARCSFTEAKIMMEEPRTVAVIAHPYWLTAVASLRPAHSIALISEPVGEEKYSSLWESCITKLTGIADLVCTSSETRYMNLVFQGVRAVLLHGEDSSPAGAVHKGDLEVPLRDYELLFLRALKETLSDLPDSVCLLQCEQRAIYYRKLRSETGPHETVSFLLSAYEYMIADPRAADSLIESFHHAVVNGRSDCVQTHYRFLSAIYARSGDLEDAVQIYGITSSDANERKYYEQLCRWLEADETQLVKAELLRLNNDYGGALKTLEPCNGETARHWKYNIHRENGALEKALTLVHGADLWSRDHQQEYALLSGAVLALRGERHGAVHMFLQAAMNDESALAHIDEMEQLDLAVQKLLGEVT